MRLGAPITRPLSRIPIIPDGGSATDRHALVRFGLRVVRFRGSSWMDGVAVGHCTNRRKAGYGLSPWVWNTPRECGKAEARGTISGAGVR